MGRKAQSAIEYMATYGWMIVAVSALGGVTYQTFSGTCDLRVEGATGTFPGPEDIGQYENQTIVLSINNPKNNPVQVERLNFSQNGDFISYIAVDKEINGRASEPVNTNRFTNAENCNRYQVDLAYQEGGLETLESTFEIIGKIKLVNIRPLFDIDPLTASTGTEINFDGSGSVATNDIEEYRWNFGDGSTATGPQVSHSYSTPGAYNVELTVTDSKGNTNSRTKQVYVGGIITYSGGNMDQIALSNSLAARCIGNNCTNATSSSDNAVETSGDRIKGTLLTDKVLKNSGEVCITSKKAFDTNQGCQKIITGPDEKLSDTNYEMTGSLNATVIKPYKTNSVCIGDNC